MNFLRFKTRLFISFWAVLVLAIFLPGFYVYNTLAKELLNETTANAVKQLNFIEWLLVRNYPFASNSELDEWCTVLGGKLGFRVTVITEGGAVIADSSVDTNELKYMENHAGREEIRSATYGDPAVSVRYSPTIKRNLIYAAKKIKPAPSIEPLFLRVAYPVSSVENRLNAYAKQFWAGIILIFAFTFLLSIYLARKLEAPIYSIIDRLKAIGAGDFSHQYITDAGREFYQLSMTLNETADRISEQMDVISEQNQEMEAIIENMREGVMLVDREGHIKSINYTLGNIAECHLSCIGKRPLEVFLSAEVQRACDNILAGGMTEYNFTLAVDEDTYYEVYATKIPEGGALIVFYDISERRRLDKIRQDFVANVSHELKTPLTSIKGYVETLLANGFSFDENARSFLTTIQKNTNQMSNIVNDLLQLTRLQEKPLGAELPTVNAVKSFQAAWETCLPMAEGKKIRLKNDFTDPLMVKADEVALIRVFRNLMDNAIRYSPEGGTIFTSVEAKTTEIIFGIRDEGPGIPSKHQERIFERFYRIDKERSRDSGGTGLGLSICKNAINSMQGRIWVESPPRGAAKGSAFFFTLPRPATGGANGKTNASA